MSTFSTNQARQIYVAQSVVDNPTDIAKGKILLAAKADYIYFQYGGPDTTLRSDLIQKGLITSARLTHGKNIQKYLNQYSVKFNSEVSATPIAGQEYLLRIDMLGYASLGIENTYQKYGFVKATVGMSVAKFFVKLAKSLALNFAREDYPVYEFLVSDGTTTTVVTSTTDEATLTGTYTELIIKELSGVWRRGTDEDMPQLANIYTDRVLTNTGLDAVWGTVTPITDKTKLSARKDSVYRQLADMEYFYMGERADKYRLVGWPRVLHTEYMIDAIGLTPEQFAGTTDTTGVSILDIHYSYVGSNESVQKSEKDVCIILPNTGGDALTLAQSIADAGISVVQKKADGTEAILTAVAP